MAKRGERRAKLKVDEMWLALKVVQPLGTPLPDIQSASLVDSYEEASLIPEEWGPNLAQLLIDEHLLGLRGVMCELHVGQGNIVETYIGSVTL